MFARQRADRLHSEGQAAEHAGDDDRALALYHKALQLEPDRPHTLYNIGLIHKYRQAWPQSLDFNRRAFELAPDDPATCWNLGIAATAVGDWATARRAWAAAGIEIAGDEGPIVGDFGLSCVRLNAEDAGEVVWVRRLDPARARILSVPYPASGFFHGDVVLHDGAPTGKKVWDDVEYSIFNAFGRLERSSYGTARVALAAPSEADVARLVELADAAAHAAEDWTAIPYLCKACSEGATHADRPHDPVWNPDRVAGIGTHDEAVLRRMLADWAGSGPGRAAEIAEIVW